jgi:hypothetical protein
MTRLTTAEAPELEFSVRGRNAITEADDEGLIFYDDVTKVHVLPDEHRFTIQVVTPDLEVDMDFPDAESVREALALFESKKVSEVHAEAPGAVRITPIESEPSSGDSGAEGLVGSAETKTPGEASMINPNPDNLPLPEQVPSRPDQRPNENAPDIARK